MSEKGLHAKNVANQVGKLSLQGNGEGVGASRDVLPVEADGQEAKTLVTVGSTKDVGEVGGILVGEAEDGDTSEEREDPLGENFPNEDAGETEAGSVAARLVMQKDNSRKVEKPELLGRVGTIMEERVEHGHQGQNTRVQHLGGVEKDGPHETSQTVPKKLTGEEQEYRCSSIGRDVVVETLDGQDLGGEGRVGGGAGHCSRSQ